MKSVRSRGVMQRGAMESSFCQEASLVVVRLDNGRGETRNKAREERETRMKAMEKEGFLEQ